MKTEKEIEQIADQVYSQRTDRINGSELKGMIVSAIKGGFVDGYTKCQEDIKELLLKAYKYGISMEAGEIAFDYKKYPDGFSQFIDTLDK